jgi:hypothetical protein
MRLPLLAILLAGFSVLTPQPASAQNADAFPLADVIAQVKKELLAAQNTPGQTAGLTLQSVQLIFAITHTTDANGKVAIGVPIISADIGVTGERKAEDGSSLTVELAPPTASMTMNGVDSRQFGITQAILATRRQLAQGLNDEPKLDPRKVSIQFKFGVARTGGGTGQIKFLIFTVGAGVTKSAAETSTITLNYEKK